MNIINELGKVYCKVTLEGNNLVINPASNSFKYKLVLDKKAIPQLIQSLVDIESSSKGCQE